MKKTTKAPPSTLDVLQELFQRYRTFEEGEHTRKDESGAAGFWLTRWVFLRLLAVIYLIAFWSFWSQASGLVGSDGILPVRSTLEAVSTALENAPADAPNRFLAFPTVFWAFPSEGFVHFVCFCGVVLSLVLLIGVAAPVCLALLWFFYLSLCTIGGIFLGYQWDILLLETGFLAIFFAPWQLWPSISREAMPSRIMLFLFRWLLFRLMWGSSLVKFASGDATWWPNLTALTFHFETQPIPTWTAWAAHQMPRGFLEFSTAGIMFLELFLPILIFCPRRYRFVGCAGLIGLQLLIMFTGNYTFFNWLTIALCVLLLDDGVFSRRIRDRIPEWTPPRRNPELQQAQSVVQVLVLICSFGVSAHLLLIQVDRAALRFEMGVGVPLPKHVERAVVFLQPFRSVGTYGLFAAMTTERPEIIVEGSRDGTTWEAYAFKYKPGAEDRRPEFVAPFQPRLDWQMWFAALGGLRSPRTQAWFLSFMTRLLEGSPSVLALLEENPFPDDPPIQVRALVYDYRFTDRATRKETGAWWTRENPRIFCPPVSLRGRDKG